MQNKQHTLGAPHQPSAAKKACTRTEGGSLIQPKDDDFIHFISKNLESLWSFCLGGLLQASLNKCKVHYCMQCLLCCCSLSSSLHVSAFVCRLNSNWIMCARACVCVVWGGRELSKNSLRYRVFLTQHYSKRCSNSWWVAGIFSMGRHLVADIYHLRFPFINAISKL